MLTSILNSPWHWLFSGFAISLVMLSLLYFGHFFGLSSTYRVWCAAGGGGKHASLFDFDWKSQQWNLFFAGGIVLGAGLAHLGMPAEYLRVGMHTQTYLHHLGIIEKVDPDQAFPLLPPALFDLDLRSPAFLQSMFLIFVGGFLSGFGARYAGGCTSGHFVSGLSNLQLPSLITLIFFFIGGILFTHFGLPLLMHAF